MAGLPLSHSRVEGYSSFSQRHRSVLFFDVSRAQHGKKSCLGVLQVCAAQPGSRGQLSEVLQAGVGSKHSGPRSGSPEAHLSRWKLKSPYWDSRRPNRQMAKQLRRSKSCGTRRSLPRLALLFAGHPSGPGRMPTLQRWCRMHSRPALQKPKAGTSAQGRPAPSGPI